MVQNKISHYSKNLAVWSVIKIIRYSLVISKPSKQTTEQTTQQTNRKIKKCQLFLNSSSHRTQYSLPRVKCNIQYTLWCSVISLWSSASSIQVHRHITLLFKSKLTLNGKTIF